MQEKICEKICNLLNEEVLTCSLEEPHTLDTLLISIGDARLVLMGEATHGTEEFYQTRIELTKRLITEKDFNAIAIEGDWTSVAPLCQYVKGLSQNSAEQSLNAFNRFPKWMWRNTTIPPFLDWLKKFNNSQNSHPIGLYGLDLYCLDDSIQAVLRYLQQHDKAAAQAALQRYACFDHQCRDLQNYAYLIEQGLKAACTQEVTKQLLELQHLAFSRLKKATCHDSDELFYALQNARLIKNAEHYYRSLFDSKEISWNIRDQHMAETLQNLIARLEDTLKKPAKIIIWAHNSHVGDARATELSAHGEINLGQIVREQFNLSSFLLGFSTYNGFVTAADNWGAEAQYKPVQAALTGSYENLFHQLKIKNFILDLRKANRLNELLASPQLQRAIGVIYRPSSERMSHYFFSHLTYQFDALIHFDQTQAVQALDSSSTKFNEELDTYPFGT